MRYVVALLAAMISGAVGLALGAAIQRWGDGVRATEHHTKRADGSSYVSDQPRVGVELTESAARGLRYSADGGATWHPLADWSATS